MGSALDKSIVEMNRSAMQLLTAQQVANAQLQLQTQQNQAVQITHMDILRSLNESTQQRNFDHIFTRIPMYNGTNKEGFLEWVERFEAASMQNGRVTCSYLLGRFPSS